MSKLFDSYRGSYGDTVEESIRFSGLKHDFFMEAKAELLKRRFAAEDWLDAAKRPRALDVGCGIGTLHPYVDGLFASLDGCDISAESITRAREENPRVRYRHYTGLRLPYDDGAFDFAFAVCVVHHVPPEDWPEFFRELFRVVRRGGLACVIEHNPLNPGTRLAVLRCPFDDDAVLLRSSRTRELFFSAGFRDVSSEFFLIFPLASAITRNFERAMSGVPIGAQYASFARA
jgi:SAM-dependent methyltransferase